MSPVNNRFLFLLFALVAAVVSGFQLPISSRANSLSTVWSKRQRLTLFASPAVIEKESVKGPAVLDRPEVERRERVDEPTKERKGMGSEAWEVRIYNDGMNTREHVARSLVQVTGMSELDAYQTMMQAHQNGIAVVGRWVYEVAEMYHDALQKNGIICDLVPVDEDM
jgi:ATP-dependent Clp protease adapter protein ClpS